MLPRRFFARTCEFHPICSRRVRLFLACQHLSCTKTHRLLPCFSRWICGHAHRDRAPAWCIISSVLLVVRLALSRAPMQRCRGFHLPACLSWILAGTPVLPPTTPKSILEQLPRVNLASSSLRPTNQGFFKNWAYLLMMETTTSPNRTRTNEP